MTRESISRRGDSDHRAEQVAALILAEFQEKTGLDLSLDPAAMERIQDAAREAALELESRIETEIHLPYLSANQTGPLHLRRVITLSELENSAAPAASTEPAPAPGVQLPDRRPVVTLTLMILLGMIYLFQLGSELLLGYDLPAALGMKVNQLILAGQYWRLITPVLLHGSLLHLGFNLYALYILGRRVERLYNAWRFLGLFLLAGISGNLFSFAFTSAPSLGSSTAIFGLLGAEAVFIYQHRNLFGAHSRIALRQIIQVAVINLLIGGFVPGIDNWGHVGGLIGGGFAAWFGGPQFEIIQQPANLVLEDRRSPRTTLWSFLLLGTGLVAILVGIIITR